MNFKKSSTSVAQLICISRSIGGIFGGLRRGQEEEEEDRIQVSISLGFSSIRCLLAPPPSSFPFIISLLFCASFDP